MKLMYTRIFMLIFYIMIITNQGSPLAKAYADEYWVNLPASPVKIIKTSKGTELIIGNYSQGQVVSYKLGWVVEEKRKITIKCNIPPQRVKMAPMNLAKRESHFVGLASVQEVKECSARSKMKLAVIEVAFEDSSLWKASDIVNWSGCQLPCQNLFESES